MESTSAVVAQAPDSAEILRFDLVEAFWLATYSRIVVAVVVA